MHKLPTISGKELLKIFLNKRTGYELDHQTGSHFILRQKESPFRRLVIPNHEEIAKGTLVAIIHEAGLTREQFFELVE